MDNDKRVMDFRGLTDEFVVHYGGRLNEVDAYTFANSLVALANSMRAANLILNPGQELEIAIQAVGSGSFRARLKTKKKSLRNLFSLDGAGTGLLIGLLGNHIFEAMHPNEPPKIIVNDDSVVFEYEDAKIILPRDAHEAYKATHEAREVREPIAEAFDKLAKDESIKEFGIADLILAACRELNSAVHGSR